MNTSIFAELLTYISFQSRSHYSATSCKKDESTKGGFHESPGYHDSLRSSKYCDTEAENKKLAHISIIS
ncbi:hypothetical protein B9Z55_009833 [Caenorhabditis nigoni]|uniref:Uncharacterized protein n=1 Tax=Caenorhabditis nigoni TaxID=1611254 RepID=A0A2G5UU75_9PELO|nr:hypothetical protein B9Z55_009833 [Caenorhabditis nigoni]